MEAARREAGQSRPRRRRRRRRATGLLVAALLGGAAVAGAADLISTGDPVPDRTSRGERYRSGHAAGFDLVAKARDPAGQTAWGVGIYTAGNGDACAIAGQ